MPRIAFRVIPPIPWMSLFSLLWFCPPMNSQIIFFYLQAAGTKITVGKWHIDRQLLEKLFTFSRSGLVPTSVEIISDMSGSIPACWGRCWTTRGWLYKILMRASSHPWYHTEPLSHNKGFLVAPMRWRLMSPSWLFRFHTKGLFCMSAWRRGRVKNCHCSMFLLKLRNCGRKQQGLPKTQDRRKWPSCEVDSFHREPRSLPALVYSSFFKVRLYSVKYPAFGKK